MVPEHHETGQLDGHAETLPRSTAAATASASTVSATSCARSIHAPRSNAATAAPSDAASVPAGRRRITEHPPQRALARETDEDGGAQRDEHVEAADELEVLIRCLPESDPRVDADRLRPHALRNRVLDALLKERGHLRHDVVVARSGLHRARLALHVHQAEVRVVVRDDSRELGVSSERGHVVHELGAELERATRDGRLGGVDRERDPGERLEHRRDSPQLLVRVDRPGPRSRRLTPHVDERRPLRREPATVRDRVRRRHEAASVGETVGRDVHDAHDRRAWPPLPRSAAVHAHRAERSAARIRQMGKNPAP